MFGLLFTWCIISHFLLSVFLYPYILDVAAHNLCLFIFSIFKLFCLFTFNVNSESLSFSYPFSRHYKDHKTLQLHLLPSWHLLFKLCMAFQSYNTVFYTVSIHLFPCLSIVPFFSFLPPIFHLESSRRSFMCTSDYFFSFGLKMFLFH